MDKNVELLIYALRYSLGRLSYAPSTVRQEIVSRLDELTENDLNVMARDIREFLETQKNVSGKEYSDYQNEEWEKCLLKLEQTLERRKLDLPKSVVFDIDGTISDASHRLHHIKEKPKDYVAFHSECVNDLPINEVVELLRYYHTNGYKVILLTRRPVFYKLETETWLAKYDIPYKLLVMCEDTHTPAIDFKREQIRMLKKYNDICAVYEDQLNLSEMFRAEGLKVFDVGGVEVKK